MKKTTAFIILALVAGLAGLGWALYASTKKAAESVKDVRESLDKATEGTSNINALAGTANAALKSLLKTVGIEDL